MKNVKWEIDSKTKVMKIEVDLTKDFGQSKTGKSICIASTQGNVPIGIEDLKLGLNVYKDKPQ